MYAVAQKEDKGLDKAVEECKYRMKRYGGESLVSDLHGRLGCLFPSCALAHVCSTRCFVRSYSQLACHSTPARPLHVAGPRREDHVNTTNSNPAY
jgi:hypothetical protein